MTTQNKLKVATIFSGIGAPEFALRRLGIPHEIVFACDNGEIEIDVDLEKIKSDISKIDNPLDKKIYVDNVYIRDKEIKKLSFIDKIKGWLGIND